MKGEEMVRRSWRGGGGWGGGISVRGTTRREA